MKNRKLRKILLTICSAMLLVCLSVGATVAYLTSQATITNTFTVGKVQITLDEAAIKQENGNWVEDSTQARVKGNQYHLLPGMSYAKDPTVTVKANSEEAYVRVLVTVNKRAELDKLFADHKYDINNIVTGISSDWTVAKVSTDENNNRIYELRYKSTVEPSTTDTVLDDIFEGIKMPGDIVNAELATISGLNINVVAHAIQADGFADADAAWAAFGN